MENVKILIDGMPKDVYGLFYIYDSKYYFIYTEKEIAENDYVVLYMTQVGKETKNTESGAIETGYMVGVEITNPEEQQKAQTAISYIVEDKKNNTKNPQIQYLPLNMLTNLKIISKKRFRLLKSIISDNFGVPLDNAQAQTIMPLEQSVVLQNVQSGTNELQQVVTSSVVSPENSTITQGTQSPQLQPLANLNKPVVQDNTNSGLNNNNNDLNIIVDYRTKYFEEEEKNKELQAQIDELTKKLNEIKKVIE